MHKYFKINNNSLQIQVFKRFILFLSITAMGLTSKSQKNSTIYQSISDYKGYSIFYIYKSVPEIKINPVLDYYWYIENEIHITKGTVGGRPLHGNFVAYYLDNNLKEKGNYTFGLKNKEWNYWYPNGNLHKCEYYKNGLLNGKYTVYNDKNQIVISGEYKKNQKHGVWKLYENNGKTFNSYTWKRGILNGKFNKNDSIFSIIGNYYKGNLNGKYIILKNNKIDTIVYYKKGKVILPKPFSDKKTQIKDTKINRIKSSENDSLVIKMTRKCRLLNILHRKQLDTKDIKLNSTQKNKKKSIFFIFRKKTKKLTTQD